MKTKAYGMLAVLIGLMILAMPMRALAHDHDRDGWGRHDNGHHYGWYKHHGDDWGWYEGRGWHHHHDHGGDRWYGPYGELRWDGYPAYLYPAYPYPAYPY